MKHFIIVNLGFASYIAMVMILWTSFESSQLFDVYGWFVRMLLCRRSRSLMSHWIHHTEPPLVSMTFHDRVISQRWWWSMVQDGPVRCLLDRFVMPQLPPVIHSHPLSRWCSPKPRSPKSNGKAASGDCMKHGWPVRGARCFPSPGPV